MLTDLNVSCGGKVCSNGSPLPLIAASAVFNSNSRIMVAALKFFLGQDQAAEDESDDDDDEDFKAVQPSKAEVYKANSKVCILMSTAPPSHPLGWVWGVCIDWHGCIVPQSESCLHGFEPPSPPHPSNPPAPTRLLCLLERPLYAGCRNKPKGSQQLH